MNVLFLLPLLGFSRVWTSLVPTSNHVQGNTSATPTTGGSTNSPLISTQGVAKNTTHANVALNSTTNPPTHSPDEHTVSHSVTTLSPCQQNMCAHHDSCKTAKPFDCYDILQNGCNISGVYTIYPTGVVRGLEVYCDQDTSDGGWTVFQKRVNGSVDFSRQRSEYAFGFGDKNGEHWLGNDIVNLMTQWRKYELRVDLESFDGETRYANYRHFFINNLEKRYKLIVLGYSGTAGDALAYQNGMPFSTADRDFSLRYKCPATYNSGWWFTTPSHADRDHCLSCNLNGLYIRGNVSTESTGLSWSEWKGTLYSYKRSEMKIRPW